MELNLVPADVRATSDAAAGPNRMQVVTLGEKSLYIERPPMFIYDPHETGFGRGLETGWTTPRTPLAYRKVTNARLIGQRLIIDRDGSVILDQILPDEKQCSAQMARFADRSTSLFHEDTDVVEADGRYSSARLASPTVEIDEPVLSLLSIEPSNYGSWLFRILPKLLFQETLGGEKFKVACWCPSLWQKNMLAFFGVTEDRILSINLGACYRFREIYVPAVLNPTAYMSEETLTFYRKVLTSHGIETKRKRLIYVSRRSRAAASGLINVRHFIDEPALIDSLQSTGFEIVEPEMMSIKEQAELFASALMVVGPSGAGMFNTVFCAPGTGVIDIEAFPNWLYAHCNYFSSCGHSYGVAFGLADQSDRSETHKRWNIGIPGMVRKISQLREIVAID